MSYHINPITIAHYIYTYRYLLAKYAKKLIIAAQWQFFFIIIALLIVVNYNLKTCSHPE